MITLHGNWNSNPKPRLSDKNHTNAPHISPTATPLSLRDEVCTLLYIKQHHSLRVQHISAIDRRNESYKRWQAHHLHRLRYAPPPIPTTPITATLTTQSIALLLVRLHQHPQIPPPPRRPQHRSRHPPLLPRWCPRRSRKPFCPNTAMETSVFIPRQ